jgi:chromosome segregation ATPase
MSISVSTFLQQNEKTIKLERENISLRAQLKESLESHRQLEVKIQHTRVLVERLMSEMEEFRQTRRSAETTTRNAQNCMKQFKEHIKKRKESSSDSTPSILKKQKKTKPEPVAVVVPTALQPPSPPPPPFCLFSPSSSPILDKETPLFVL